MRVRVRIRVSGRLEPDEARAREHGCELQRGAAQRRECVLGQPPADVRQALALERRHGELHQLPPEPRAKLAPRSDARRARRALAASHAPQAPQASRALAARAAARGLPLDEGCELRGRERRPEGPPR